MVRSHTELQEKRRSMSQGHAALRMPTQSRPHRDAGSPGAGLLGAPLKQRVLYSRSARSRSPRGLRTETHTDEYQRRRERRSASTDSAVRLRRSRSTPADASPNGKRSMRKLKMLRKRAPSPSRHKDTPSLSTPEQLASDNKTLRDENALLKGELKKARLEVEKLANEVLNCKELIAIQGEQQHSDAVEEYIHMTVMLVKSKYPNIECSSERLIDLAKAVPLDSVHDRVESFCSRLHARDGSIVISSPRSATSRKGSGLNFAKLSM